MDKFALLPAADRAAVLQEAAARLGIDSPAIIEKDFWVCWMLGQIFTADSLPGTLFKGGTSLSKVYGIITRFSEDVDIVLDRHTLGFEGDSDQSTLPAQTDATAALRNSQPRARRLSKVRCATRSRRVSNRNWVTWVGR